MKELLFETSTQVTTTGPPGQASALSNFLDTIKCDVRLMEADEIFISTRVFLVKPNGRMGRPPREFTSDDLEKATKMRVEEELSYEKIAENLNVSYYYLYNKLPKELKEATKNLITNKRMRKAKARKEREIRGL